MLKVCCGSKLAKTQVAVGLDDTEDDGYLLGKTAKGRGSRRAVGESVVGVLSSMAVR